MKRRAFPAVCFLLFLWIVNCFAFPAQIGAQTPLETTQTDYDHVYKLYLDAHDEYEIARSKYQTYRNLTSQTVAIEKTALMLEARDQVMITFLHLIQAKLTQETELSFGRLGVINHDLNQEVEWYQAHQSKPSSAASVNDLILVSREAEGRYTSTTRIVYRALLESYLYKENQIIALISDELVQTESLISLIRERKDKDTSLIERWLIDGQNKYALGKDKYNESKSIDLASIKDKELVGVYNQASQRLEQANQYFKEVNHVLIEILTEIKRAD